MSHHLDSPAARQNVRLDITDLYVFRGEVGTVLVINVDPSGAGDVPGFHPGGMYEFAIDLDGDAHADLSYRIVFDERDFRGTQRFTIRRVDGQAASDPFAGGVVVADGITGTETVGSDGIRAWAGKAGDPFWIDPAVLHAVGRAFATGSRIDVGAWTPAAAVNLFAGHTVYALVLEIPNPVLVPGHHARPPIGVWAVAHLVTTTGGWRPINRAGIPMLHPLFAQFDPLLADRLNIGTPDGDRAAYGALLTAKVAAVAAAYGTTADPRDYGARFAACVLPNILPYRVGTPAVFGFAGWNGRSLTDNAADVMFSMAANTPIGVGLGPASATAPPQPRFPYVPATSPSPHRRGATS